MAIRGDKLTIMVDKDGSGTFPSIIASSTDFSLDLSAEALETTSQSDGLNATYIGGKVSGTASGSYLLAADGEQFEELFNYMNNGYTVDIEVYRDSTKFLEGEGVITSLGLTGGLSDSLVTGAYTIQLSGNMATS